MTGIQKRVYVGNILQNQQSCLEELFDRFTKFGTCLSDEFEKHVTFAYMNMEFEDENQFQRLRNSFNNVKFKGNELRVGLAKPSWKESWHQRHEEEENQSRQLDEKNRKRDWEYFKKIENINMTWNDRRSVIQGRVRNAPRSKVQARNTTFRVNVGGSLKVYKCYKNKLWGYERNKDLKDLVCKFVNNKWRDGFDHIVDRLDYSRSKRSVASIVEHNPSAGHVEATEEVEEEAQEEEQEKEKVKDVLASVLKDFEFDKPMLLSDDEDYELTSNKTIGADKLSTAQEAVKENFDEESKLPSEPLQEKSGEENDPAREGQDDEEFIPTFAAKRTEGYEETDAGEIGNTETLRNIFNPESSEGGSFKLIAESDEDIDHDNDEKFEEVTATPQEVLQEKQPSQDKEKDYLFFPHFDSPFLVGQTKLSKLKVTDISETLNNWDETFWENRAVWTKDMKRRQRDALRQLSKKRTKKNGGILL